MNFVRDCGVEMAWAKPEHSKNVVDKAGEILANPPSFFEDDDPANQHFLYDNWNAYQDAIAVINNWRSAHSYPLNVFQTLLRYKAAQVDTHALVSQRIKRLPAIELKLRLNSTMALSQMQDIGGCRAVVRSLRGVNRLVNLYEQSTFKHSLTRITNYIEKPRASGYRSVHLMYRYHHKHKSPYDGLRIELQIRSRVQHAWATAVETVGTFLRQALKSSRGDDEWLRFFALMGSAIATREGTPLVPGTPTEREDLIAELRRFYNKLQVEKQLGAYQRALHTTERERIKGSKYFLLVLNAATTSVTITGFRANQLQAAFDQYTKTEQAIKSEKQENTDTVLVSARSLQALRHAYPSYFLDTSLFINVVKDAIAK